MYLLKDDKLITMILTSLFTVVSVLSEKTCTFTLCYIHDVAYINNTFDISII